MTYRTIIEMNGSPSLRDRIIAAAAQEGADDPVGFTQRHMWKFISDVEWVARWDDATVNYNRTKNPDTGDRPDVITDALILAAVQPMVQAENTTQ